MSESNETPTLTPTPGPPKPPVHWLVRAIRLTLIVVLLYFGWTTYLSYREMLHIDTVPQEEIDPADAVALIPELLMQQPEEGSWVIAGLPFQVETAEVEADKLAAALDAPFELRPTGKTWPLDGSLKTLLGLFKAQPLDGGTGVVYRADGKDQKIVLVTRREGATESIVGGRLARRASGKRWSILQARVAATTSKPETGRRLLPLPPGTRILAERINARDEAIAQLVLPEGDLPQAQSYWTKQGWSVRKVKGWEEGQLVVCYKEGVSVSALALPSAKAGDPTALLLVRLPEPRSGPAKKRE